MFNMDQQFLKRHLRKTELYSTNLGSVSKLIKMLIGGLQAEFNYNFPFCFDYPSLTSQTDQTRRYYF